MTTEIYGDKSGLFTDVEGVYHLRKSTRDEAGGLLVPPGGGVVAHVDHNSLDDATLKINDFRPRPARNTPEGHAEVSFHTPREVWTLAYLTHDQTYVLNHPTTGVIEITYTDD